VASRRARHSRAWPLKPDVASAPPRLSRRLVRAARSAASTYTQTACGQRAAAISYHVLFSLVPFVALLISVLEVVLRDATQRSGTAVRGRTQNGSDGEPFLAPVPCSWNRSGLAHRPADEASAPEDRGRASRPPECATASPRRSRDLGGWSAPSAGDGEVHHPVGVEVEDQPTGGPKADGHRG
jgi:hypothetical protein